MTRLCELLKVPYGFQDAEDAVSHSVISPTSWGKINENHGNRVINGLLWISLERGNLTGHRDVCIVDLCFETIV